MEHLPSLFDRALDAVVGMDHRGNVIAWNKAAEELFGWSREEAIGRSMGGLIVPPQHRASHSKGLKKYNITRQGPVLEKRIRISAIDRKNTEFPIELSIFPMIQSGGDIFYAFIRSLQFEEARKSEQKLRTQEAELLFQVAKNLIEDNSLEEFTQLCLRAICDVAGLDAAHVFFVRGDSGRRRLVPSGIWFVTEPKFKSVAEDTATRLFRKGEGLPGQAWQRKDVATVANIPERTDFIRRVSFSQSGLTKGFAIPIEQDGQTFAVMEFFGAENARIDDEMIRLVRTVAMQIGLAIQRKRVAEERDILRRELAHRVGNSLAILSAIFRATASKANSVSELAASFSVRIQSVSRAYHSISQASDQRNFDGLLQEAFDLLPDKERLCVEVPPLVVAGDAILPLSLLFSELVTNHLKHGEVESIGHINVSAKVDSMNSSVQVTWVEPGSKKPTDPKEGYGSILAKSMVERQLSGSISRKFDRDGFSIDISLPSFTFI